MFFESLPQTVPQIADPATLRQLAAMPKEMWAVIFLLSGGMSFLILREVFSFLKLRRANGSGSGQVPTTPNGPRGSYSPVPPEDVRAHYQAAIKTDVKIETMTETIKTLGDCATRQTAILETLSRAFERHDEAMRQAIAGKTQHP